MQSMGIEVLRRTKLDIAQWITVGLGKCANLATSQLLARYASAQLESAALIPASCVKESAGPTNRSLLRLQLKKSDPASGPECIAVLQRVSNAMIRLLKAHSAAPRRDRTHDITVARLLRHEIESARMLAEIVSRTAAA